MNALANKIPLPKLSGSVSVGQCPPWPFPRISRLLSAISLRKAGQAQSRQQSGWVSKSQISAIPALGVCEIPGDLQQIPCIPGACNENSVVSPSDWKREPGSLQSQELCYFSAPHRESSQASSPRQNEGPPWRAPFLWARFPSYKPPCERPLGMAHCLEFKHLNFT